MDLVLEIHQNFASETIIVFSELSLFCWEFFFFHVSCDDGKPGSFRRSCP